MIVRQLRVFSVVRRRELIKRHLHVVIIAAGFVLVVRACFEVHEIVVLIVSAVTHVNCFFGADLAIDVADRHVQLVTLGDDFV